MSNTNIKYSKGIVNVKTRVIEIKIKTLLAKKTGEYDKILELFSNSQCDQATALREEIQKEKETVNTMVEFYTTLVTMIHNASMDVDQVEENYAATHVTQ